VFGEPSEQTIVTLTQAADMSMLLLCPWSGLGSTANWCVLVCILISKERLCGTDRPPAYSTVVSVIANL